MGFRAQIWRTDPDCGIAVVVGKWPNLIIDPNTGMSLASYFQSSEGTTLPGAFVFRGVDDSLLQKIDRNDGGQGDSATDERQTAYRWRADMAAPIRLTWDELAEVWSKEKR